MIITRQLTCINVRKTAFPQPKYCSCRKGFATGKNCWTYTIPRSTSLPCVSLVLAGFEHGRASGAKIGRARAPSTANEVHSGGSLQCALS